MPRIVLKDLQTEKTYTVLDTEATMGRDPASAIVVEGENSRVVSGHHARIFFLDDEWWIEDTSRNGTILDNERLRKGERHPISVGRIVGMGETGPRFRVLALEGRRVAETIVEAPAAQKPPTSAQQQEPPDRPRPPNPEAPSAEHAPAEHAPAVEEPAQAASVAAPPDPGSAAPEEPTEPMAPADDWIVHVVLRELNTNQRWDVRGEVVKIGRSPECLVQIPPEQGASVSRVHAEVALHEAGVVIRDAKSRNGTYVNNVRLVEPQPCQVADLITLGAGGPTFCVEELHIVKAAARPLIRLGFPRASRSGNPRGGEKTPGGMRSIDAASGLARRSFSGLGRTAFFRDVLEDMSSKTARRVRIIVWTSVAATVVVAIGLLHVTQRRVAESEQRMAEERRQFEARADSIRLAARRETETLRASLAEVARSNQNAVGLVTTFRSGGGIEGTGFAITPSGYFLTNRHVVLGPDGRSADSVFVTMADNPYGNWFRADVVGVGDGDIDVAVLRLRGYRGPYIKRFDWSSAKVRQGEPAALIGFPNGFMMARDIADTVRTSMSAGIFSKITPAQIQFDGFSQGGSSGSPVFTAGGEVVAVHFAGLKGTAGLGFAVPVAKIIPFLPSDVRAELGLR